MMNWLLDDALPLVAFVIALGIALKLLLSLFGGERRAPGEFRVTVFCEHCNWEGRVTTTRMACGRCGSKRLMVLTA